MFYNRKQFLGEGPPSICKAIPLSKFLILLLYKTLENPLGCKVD